MMGIDNGQLGLEYFFTQSRQPMVVRRSVPVLAAMQFSLFGNGGCELSEQPVY